MAGAHSLEEIGLDHLIWDAAAARCDEPECHGPARHTGPHRHFTDGLRAFTTWGH